MANPSMCMHRSTKKKESMQEEEKGYVLFFVEYIVLLSERVYCPFLVSIHCFSFACTVYTDWFHNMHIMVV